MAELVAKMLWEIKAVHFRATSPTSSSGMASPVYIDCRKLISYPRIRSAVMDFAAATILRESRLRAVRCGGRRRDCRYSLRSNACERSRPADDLRAQGAEGTWPQRPDRRPYAGGARVLVIEDLTTPAARCSSSSTRSARPAASSSTASPLFYYDIFPEARGDMKSKGVDLHYIATWRNVLAVARELRFDEKTLNEVEAFLNAPLDWSGRNGGVSALAVQ